MTASVRSRAFIGAFFCGLTLAAAGLGAGGAAAELAATVVKGAAIRTDLVGNTIRFVTSYGKAARAYLAPDGTLRGNYEGRRFKGRWSIKRNQLCLRFPKDPDRGCWTVVRYRDGRLQLFARPGLPVSDLGVAKGNPDKF